MSYEIAIAALADPTRRALAELLGRDGSLSELVEALDRRLREAPGEDDEAFDARARAVALEDVLRRLEIDRPGYAT